MAAYKHLLVGLDLSEESSIVLKKAQQFAAANEALISVAHVVEPLAFAYGGDVPLDMTEAQSIVEKQAEIRLNKILEEHQITAHKNCVAIGQTSTEIHRLAEEHQADLIVVGSHGRHGLALLFGSTANGVLHGAQCDVLAVRV